MAATNGKGRGDHEGLVRKEVVLVSRPEGMPSDDNFEVRQSELVFTQPPPHGAILLKVLLVSIDPYLRELMRGENDLGETDFELGKPIQALSVSKVITSGNLDFKEGDIVVGQMPVADYVLLTKEERHMLKKINCSSNVPLAHYLGVLGMPGHTAWVGLNIIAHIEANQEIFISAAGGAVGSLVGQLAKLKGCRVVGSAGSDEKVKMLKETYKFDDAFNYKTEKDLVLALKRHCPSGFDIYFENVGGAMLEAALENIRRRGQIVGCGMISQYNKKQEERDGVHNLMHVVGKRLKMQGFVVFDHMDTWDAFFTEVSGLLEQGKIHYQTDILGRGVEEFGKALVRLLKGENKGKAILLVSEE